MVKGDVVWVESPPGPEPWRGFAVVHRVVPTYYTGEARDLHIRWISCNDQRWYYNHIDGSDCFVPAEWCTKIELR